MKKSFVLGIMGILLSASVVMPVSAHGHHHRQAAASTVKETENIVCEVCTVDGCEQSGLHVHDDVTYCGYDHGDGYCDGSCGAVEVCGVEGCSESGHHTHNKQTYCGYAHESGYCDNSCAVTSSATTGRHHGHRRHHGR